MRLTMHQYDIIFAILFGAMILMFLYMIATVISTNKNVRNKINSLSANELEMTPDEFFTVRNASLGGKGRRHVSTSYNYPGVYILHNKTKNMFYVGQGQRVLDRVNQHFTGKGNGDVYADYKYGDEFTIRTISLENSGYDSLNRLEKDTIMTYEAFSKGYNKTRGNR